ncbi:SusC/RagA family TonB-linked outer membrane protein [Sphingobacterium sp. PCS056]|uniref:SusC/RagA family TonB-linked outer membrane protein n=1 Tax=Sphingobacterium sp. PCS056 TaxID=2931400 RepID=UPI00200DBA6B|nr:SusC/RagA family TonB-linked outer membrane protein [Sphingobacterium sp. PCS056]UPZ34600.1 SusC/RagA family TonB-linked outer membrane protein [Sphingobacterium sp. PCS056]
MQKTCNRESYALSRRKSTVLSRALFFGLPSKTDQKINTLKSSILKIGNLRKDSSQQENHQPPVSALKASWNQVVLCYLLSPMLHAFNLIFCLLKALKVIAIPCIMVIAVFHSLCLYAQTPRKDSGVNGQHELLGRVVSSMDGKALQGVSVLVDAEYKKVSTKDDGTFRLTITANKGKVKFTHVGYKTAEVDYAVGITLNVAMIPSENQLDEVEVVNTGYQNIPKERSAGSFEFVDNKLLNRKVSLDFISRLEDVVPSISSTKTYDENRGVFPNFNVRGQSSIRSNVWPLIVVDGFPYHGNFNNINPNDIENISILKDASASSIWGSQSGNGVVVITTKKGKLNESLKVSFNGNLTFENKPNLYYFPQMNTSDYIDVEMSLYEKGYYNSRMSDITYAVTPVVQLLKDNRDGKISEQQLNSSIDRLRGIDMRDDFLKYIYRKAVKQQYNVQLSAGSAKLSNIFSIGYDKQLKDVVTSSADRFTFRSQSNFKPTQRLEFNLSTQFSSYNTGESLDPVLYNQLGKGSGNFPYMEMADEFGNPLIVEATAMNREFRDTVAQGRLLDWSYRPLAELYESSIKTDNRENMLGLQTKYTVMKGLNLSLLYNFRAADGKTSEQRDQGSIEQRSANNYFAVWDDNTVKWNYPLGGRLLVFNQRNNAHQGRFQIDYQGTWGIDHSLNLLAGTEIRQQKELLYTSQFFGYDSKTHAFQPVDLVNDLPYLNGRFGVRRISDYSKFAEITNRFTSFFANVGYTYKKRYIINASARKDASNLFGVNTNDKGQPFWSIGGAWIASEEGFMKDGPFEYLKFRATYGKNGNVNNTTSAYAIMQKSNQTNFLTGLPYASMRSPENPYLRWESVGMFNVGMDFRTKGGRFGGAVEYYIKTPKDLILESQVDPTTGFAVLVQNSADLKGKGVDISLNSKNIQSSTFEWNTDLVFAYSRTKVTKSYLDAPFGKVYRTGAYSARNTPIVGSDLTGVVTYKWAGLDPLTGKPRGYIDGELSTDYTNIVNSTPLTDMDIAGSALPLYFGSLRNTFRYKNIDFSFNISYQLGHKFVRKSIHYSNLVTGGVGHSDYALRWQNPGDEVKTDVPVFTYPANKNESDFYNYSSALVEPAGQIKLRDIQVGYSLKNRYLKDLRIYAYAANIMTLWRENKWGLDPEFGNNPPDPFAGSLGISFNF